jgi:sugar lactone lactonase YvrE
MAYNIDIACQHLNSLGEGPVWDSVRKTICWADIINGKIHEFDPSSKSHSIIQVNEMVGSFAVCTNGDFVAALEHGFSFIDRNSGEKTFIGDPESGQPENRFNDGKCDPAGRFWAGSMSFNTTDASGHLYLLDNNHGIHKRINDITISNGLDWSLDYKTFYYIDTPTFQVDAFDYDNATGEIANRRKAINIPREEGFPDGMCIDMEGMLWIAHWGGWQITRWDPGTGEKLLSIKLPVSQVTSLCFGGAQLKDIYITSAREGLSEEDLEKEPLAGSLLRISNTAFTGRKSNEFIHLHK